MNERSLQFGYEPKCTYYPKKTRKGLVFYYLRYYLRGGKKVSKAVGDKKSLARKLMFEKEQNLRKGVFDAFDLERIPESIKVSLQKPRILLNEALERYMKATSYNKETKNQQGCLWGFKKSHK